MASLKLVDCDYFADESEVPYQEIILKGRRELEPIEQEHLDFAENVMQEHGDDPEKIAKAINIPIVASCGAGNYTHFNDVVEKAYASAVAAGSLFVYHGSRKAVLINYPTMEERKSIFKKN